MGFKVMVSFSTGTGVERVGIPGPVLLALDAGLLCKNKKQRGSTEARPLPLRCLSQFLPGKEKINCFEDEFSAYLSPTGWPGIYSSCFSQLDGDKNSFLLDGGSSFLITVRLIRDN